MSKFEPYKFFSSVEPVLVHRISVIREKFRLLLFPAGWEEAFQNIWTLTIDRDDAWKRYIPQVLVKRFFVDGITYHRRRTYAFDPTKEDHVRNLRELLFIRFDIGNLPLGCCSVDSVEAFLSKLPMHKRFSYSEVVEALWDEKLGCSRRALVQADDLERKIGGYY